MLRDIRKLIFPQDLSLAGNERKLCELILSHSPLTRPSCAEVLASKLLPPKYEEEELAEAFKTIVHPRSPYFNRLIQSIFGQQLQPSQDLTYDYNSTGFDRSCRTVIDRVQLIIVCLYLLI